MLWLLASVALAGRIYVNDVDVTDLTDQTFEDVVVTFDADGDVYIDAPQYEIEVLEAEGGEGTETTATRQPEPAQVQATPEPSQARTAPKPEPSGVPEGRWWLVTEDNGSRGHSVEVYINGELVTTITSGGEQVIEDVGPWLHPGTNEVRMVSQSEGAGGGALYLYLGTGSNEEGTLNMDPPQVQFGLGASRTGRYERTYGIEVPGGS